MAYQFSNAAREIAVVKHISTRSLLFALASAVDAKTGTCFHSAGCLMHWSGLSKGTFYAAVEELESLGILSRERRRKGNRTNLWRLDIKKMESLRVSWQDIKPQDAAPEPQDEPHGDSGMGLPEVEGAFDELEVVDWCNHMNDWMKCKIGTDEYYTLSKVQKIMEETRSTFARVKEVIEALSRAAEEGRIRDYFPTIGGPGKGRMTHAAFSWNSEKSRSKFTLCAEAYDKVHSMVTVSRAFEIEEE
jgi:hypothetical protein